MKKFDKYTFKEIEKNEKIIKIIHRHWFNIFTQYVVIIAMILSLIVILSALPYFFPIFKEIGFKKLALFIESLFAIFIWIYGFFIWIDYYFDIWVITSERIINIEQKGLFVRSMSELKYGRIQDVTAEEKGIIPTLLEYGNVYVQTAAEQERFIFRKVAYPYKLKDMIMDMQKEQIKEETNELGEMIREEIHKKVD